MEVSWGIHPIQGICRWGLRSELEFTFMAETSIILVAEDRADDIELIKKALTRARISNPVYFVRDGEETMAYLSGARHYANREEYPFPDLLLLDLKMPRVSGFEVLSWIRQQPRLCTLRVVVLTASEDIRDVNMAYKLGANSFLVKPLDFEDFVELSEFINAYWLDKAPETSSPSRADVTRPASQI